MKLPLSPPNASLRGILWMVVCTLSFVFVTVLVRALGTHLPAAEAAFLRYAIGIVIMLPSLVRLFYNRPKQKLMRTFVLRGAVHALGVTLWFFAMARIPIAEVTAIGYITPICITIGAAIFLGETLRARRVIGVLCGCFGVFIILRPGFAEINIGQFAQLITAPLFAASYLMAKSFTDETDSTTIVAMLTLFTTIFLLPIALLDWHWPNLRDLMFLTAVAIGATFGHYALTKAFDSAPISVTQPITFLQLVWASALGFLIFGEEIDIFVILGGTIIVAAATFISHREVVAAKKQITPPAATIKLH